MLKSKNLKIGILHLDGDLYHSVKEPLENLSKSVVKGGFIVFDDFILESDIEDAFPGARKAYEEFISNNTQWKTKKFAKLAESHLRGGKNGKKTGQMFFIAVKGAKGQKKLLINSRQL